MAVTPLKLKFGRLIREYLRGSEIRQKVLAERLGISGSAISQMIHGKIVLNQQQLEQICEMLHLDRIKTYELTSMLMRIRNGVEEMTSPLNQMLFGLRCERGLSLRQLSNLSGISISHLEAFEKHFDAVPTLDEAQKLAPILGCSALSLLQCAGVGGLSSEALNQLQAAQESGPLEGEEAAETAAMPYQAEPQIPVLSPAELETYDGKSGIYEFARTHASRVLPKPANIKEENAVYVQVLGRDISFGIPGTLQLLLVDERPAGFRKLNFCRDDAGKFSLQETIKNVNKELRMAGMRRSTKNLIWEIPVLEILIRPVKPEAAGAGQ